MLKDKLDNYFSIEDLPQEILLEIIFLLKTNDKLSLRQASTSFSRLINREGAWSGQIKGFYAEENIFPKLIEDNFHKKIKQRNLSAGDLTKLLKNLKNANGDSLIEIDEEKAREILSAKVRVANYLRNRDMVLPHVICLLITLAVLITGMTVFFYDEKDYDRAVNTCHEYDMRELALLRCVASTNRYVAKRSFFSMPGAFGSGAILKYVDSALHFKLIKKDYMHILDDQDERRSLMSKVAWLTFKNRNVISFAIILPMTLSILNKIAFSLEIDVSPCFEGDDLSLICLEEKRDQQIEINERFLAIIGAVAGYYVPAAINSSCEIVKYLSNKISQCSKDDIVHKATNVGSNAWTSVKTGIQSFSNFFLQRSSYAETLSEDEVPLLRVI
ncbi:MAG: F-box protein [Gammaproteobacteria bacterium]|nr:F-box protein [Gammaproteobacteria bacterium]